MSIWMRTALAGATALICVSAQAANGDIDTTFGENGLARTHLTDVYGNSNGCKPVVQADGKIVICGTRQANGSSGFDFLVARYNADGTPDLGFSFDGLTTIDFDNGVGQDVANGIAVQADGKIVVVGITHTTDADNNDIAVARLTADGELDTSFGAGTGKTTIAFDLNAGVGNDVPGAVAVQSDGKIVIAGTATTTTGAQVAVVRLLGDGSRDSTFNLTGKVNFGFSIPGSTNENDNASGLAIDDSGRIVLGVQVSYTDADTVGQSVFGVARLLANGQLDSNFHANGRSTLEIDPGSGISAVLCTGLALQHNGRVVLSGYANSSSSTTSNPDVAAVRFLPDGTPDSSFGTAGRVLVAFDLTANGTDAAIGVAEQSNGRIVLVGTSLGAGSSQLATAVRLTQSGDLDQSFGSLGKATYDFALTVPDGQAFNGAAFQGTKIIVSGVGYVPPGGDTSHIDAFVVRLDDDTIFANSFE